MNEESFENFFGQKSPESGEGSEESELSFDYEDKARQIVNKYIVKEEEDLLELSNEPKHQENSQESEEEESPHKEIEQSFKNRDQSLEEEDEVERDFISNQEELESP